MHHLIQFLGRLHPLIVHLPIGFLMLTIGVHLLLWRGKYPAARELLPALWLANCGSALLACLAGYFLSLEGGYAETTLQSHMCLAIGLALGSGVVCLLLQRGVSARLQLAGVLGVAVLLLATGHQGGNLTHGETYLTEPLYALVGNAPGIPARRPVANQAEALVYQDIIEPVLEQKCWQCHSAQKQKGALRLDAIAYLRKGGKHGAVITAGDTGKSSLYTRLVLPEVHKERMPPKGKPGLTQQEIDLIGWWITRGKADFDKRVAQIPQDDPIRTTLAALGNPDTPDEVNQTEAETPTA